MAKDNKTPRKPRLQPVSRDTSFTKLKACTSFTEADRRLRLGWSLADVARYMQEEGDYTDVTHDSLSDVLSRYYDTIPAMEKALAINSPAQQKLAKQVNAGLDEVAEIQRLYDMQMERIEIDFTHEKNMNKLMPTTGKEIYVAMKLLNQSAQVKMDLGLIKRQLGSLEVNGQLAAAAGEQYGRESVGKVLADPEARRKVLGLAEKLMLLAAKAGIDAAALSREVQEQEKNIIDVVPVEQENNEEPAN